MTANPARLAMLLMATLVAVLWSPGLTVDVHVLLRPAAATQAA